MTAEGIRKDFAGVTVLDGVDLDVERGEVHALLGANGAGKSTLIKVLGGLYPDAGGTVEIDGRRVDLGSPGAALRSGIGIVHQEFDLVPDMTAAENIFLGLEDLDLGPARPILQPVKRRLLERAARRVLERYGLGLDPAARVRALTAGAQQLVVIARVLALGSEVMIFDEPTARLGPADKERLFGVFASLRRTGKTIVSVTHDLDEVMATADRASVMRDGCMVARRRVDGTSVEELSRLMVGGDVRRAAKRTGAARGAPVLTVEGLSDGVSFDDVSLTVAAREIVGLVGRLGSGRHELTRCIQGSRRSTGRIAAARADRARRATAPIGFVPEHRRSEGLFAELSVAANIAVGFLKDRGLFTPLPRAEIERTAADAVRTLQIKAASPDQAIGQLSGGNQQKAIFGRAMVSAPAIYVIEAPTVGVDVKAAVERHRQIFGLAERGAGILLATDDLNEVILLSDRILVMLAGAGGGRVRRRRPHAGPAVRGHGAG